MNFIEELKWRGMIHNIMPGTEEQLNKGTTAGYIGFDPTAASLHVGSLVQIMILVHFQRCGHKPIALVGGATGMIGDPSGKNAERNLLSEDVLQANVEGIKQQLSKFLNFDIGEQSAELVNNYDWFKDFSLLGFMRDVGKHLTVSYMMAKDSVQNRLETGISFTEFSYQLIQGYDFYYLWKNKKAMIQLGGSDQWGNITAGTELIRRIGGGEAYACTVPLLTKADGTKFGKSEGGENYWLDAALTSPYKFYQFWLNSADEDAKRYIRIFSVKTRAEIEALETEHDTAPHLRQLQKALAEEITTRVHSAIDLEKAQQASGILFGNSTAQALESIDEQTFLDVFDGVPTFNIEGSKIAEGIEITNLLAEYTTIMPSKGEAKRSLQGGAISINKAKVDADYKVSNNDLLNDKYILVQKGKKNNYLIVIN